MRIPMKSAMAKAKSKAGWKAVSWDERIYVEFLVPTRLASGGAVAARATADTAIAVATVGAAAAAAPAGAAEQAQEIRAMRQLMADYQY